MEYDVNSDRIRKMIEKEAEMFTESSGFNYVSEEDAIYPKLSGMRIFETPIAGVSSADDRLFYDEFRKCDVIHPEHMVPEDVLAGAGSVISFFWPFTEEVKRSNRTAYDEPYDPEIKNQHCSAEWLHARIEGHEFMMEMLKHMCVMIRDMGYDAQVPMLTDKYRLITPTISNWSERHIAYASGLGTFGASRGIITEKGMAGRFGSIVTTLKLQPDKRAYSSPFEYCIMCGACQTRCPEKAIDLSRGTVGAKEQKICEKYVRGSRLLPHGPREVVRYGCGKCSVKVPCESKRP